MTWRARSLALIAGVVACLAVGVAGAGSASAHAELVASTPAEGARLDTAPSEVTLEFSEPVSVGAGYVRVVDADGKRVDTGAPSAEGATVVVALRGDLPEAGYLVSFRVTSADSHPISGGLAFVVGDGEPLDASLADAVDDGDPVIRGLLVVARWLGFAGLALGLGVPAFLVLCWPAGWTVPRLRRTATAGAAAVAAGGVLSLLLQGPYEAGSGVGAMFDPSLAAATATSRYGIAVLIRVALALALLAVLRFPAAGRAQSLGAVVGAGLVVTTAAVGHPVAGDLPGFAVTVTSVHVAAMVLWVGGLVALVAGLLRPGVRAGDLATALPRFSRLAFGSVVALVLTGVLQTVREVGTATALFSTTYGWILVAKVVLVLLVLGAAGLSRVWVQQHLGAARPRPGGRRRLTAHAFAAPGAGGATDDPALDDDAAARARAAAQADAAVDDVLPFRRSVLLETAVIAVVLVLSAVLAGTPPARSVVAEPVDVTLPLEGGAGPEGTVQISVDPAVQGTNVLHLYVFDATGRLTQPQDLRVELAEPQQQIGPLAVDLEPAGPGHYVAADMDLPSAGTWTLTATVRLDEFTATGATTTFPVR